MKKYLLLTILLNFLISDYQLDIIYENIDGIWPGMKVKYEGLNVGKVKSINPNNSGGFTVVFTFYENKSKFSSNKEIPKITANMSFKLEGSNIIVNSDISEKSKKKTKQKSDIEKDVDTDRLTEIVTEGDNGESIIHYYDYNEQLVRKVKINQGNQISAEENYKNGILDVHILYSYHENGQLSFKLYSDMNMSPYGEATMYHENGQLYAKGKVNPLGDQVGLWVAYDENGKVIGSQVYPDYTK